MRTHTALLEQVAIVRGHLRPTFLTNYLGHRYPFRHRTRSLRLKPLQIVESFTVVRFSQDKTVYGPFHRMLRPEYLGLSANSPGTAMLSVQVNSIQF